MSRTYRLRHTPKPAGHPLKYVDGDVYGAETRWRAKIWYQIAHVHLGVPCRWPDFDIESVRHENCIPKRYFTSNERKGLFEKYSRGVQCAVGPIWNSVVNAHRGHGPTKWWKRHGNRIARCRTREVLNKCTLLEQEVALDKIRYVTNGEGVEDALYENWHVVDKWKWM